MYSRRSRGPVGLKVEPYAQLLNFHIFRFPIFQFKICQFLNYKVAPSVYMLNSMCAFQRENIILYSATKTPTKLLTRHISMQSSNIPISRHFGGTCFFLFRDIFENFR